MAFVAVYGVSAIVTLTGQHYWGDDWGQYVLHARNLATGHPYPDTGYLFNPDRPTVGPPTYPPGLPLLLAPVILVAGIDLTALKLPGLLCLLLAIPLTMRLHEPTIGARAAIVGAVLVSLHPVYWHLRQSILSESPYILFSLLAVWWARKTRPEYSVVRAFADGALAGLLIHAATISRAIGVTLLPAVLVHGWAQRRPLPWFVGMATAFLGLVALQSMWLVSPPTYHDELRRPTMGRVAAQPLGYVTELSYLFPLPLGLGPVAAGLLMVFSVVGAWHVVFRDVEPVRVAGPGLVERVRTFAARIPLHFWYAGAYCAALLVVSVRPDPRLVIPMLPITIPLAVFGLWRLVKGRMRRPRTLVGGFAVAIAAYFVFLGSTTRFAPEQQMATCPDCLAMFEFMRTRTPPHSVVLFNKPRMMALLGGRRSWAPSYRYTPEQLERRARRVGLDLVVHGQLGGEFARRYPLPDAVRERLEAPGASVLYRNASFVVVRPGPAKPSP